MVYPRPMTETRESWPLHLLHILFGYSLVVVPTALFIYYSRRRSERTSVAHEDSSCFWRFARSFSLNRTEYSLVESSPPREENGGGSRRGGLLRSCAVLAICFTGIQTTLVVMGFLQERVMTLPYARVSNPEESDNFGDAQFLVFCNRVVALAICLAILAVNYSRQPPHVPAYYKHSFTSLSNTISSWCQYEALKYVSFPTQTICKASKVVATMLMATVMRGQRYSWAEYGCGIGIAAGASLFLLATGHHSEGETGISSTSISGVLLMIGYLVADAFTLNWQKKLFDTRPRVSKMQMMLGVNAFSAVLCLVSLWEQGSLSSSISFALSHSGFTVDAFLLSLSGACGQLFIYTTIEKFGPIIFAVIMTIRQMFSIIVSTLSYGHAMSPLSFSGFLLVFLSIFLDIYRRHFEKGRSK